MPSAGKVSEERLINERRWRPFPGRADFL